MPSPSSSLLLSTLYIGLTASAQVDAYSCPGAFFVNTDGSSCCVGGQVQTPYLSVCSGWPVCKGPTTTTQTVTPLSCATVIAYADSDYSSLVSEASESLEASGTQIRTTLGALASAGSGPSGSVSMTGSGSAAASSMAASGSSSTAQPSSSGGAGVVAAQMGLLGGAALGAAVLL